MCKKMELGKVVNRSCLKVLVMSLLVLAGLCVSTVAYSQTSQTVTMKVGLRGGASGGALGVIPGKEPYCAEERYSDNCSTVSTLTGVARDVVDWVLLEVRSVPVGSSNLNQSAGVNSVVARKPALLLSNGRVVDADLYAANVVSTSTGGASTCDSNLAVSGVDTCPGVRFTQQELPATNDDLYLVIRHRNHLAIMSASPVTVNGNLLTYDFGTTITQTYPGSGGIGTVSGTPAMFSGAAEGNNNVTLTDYSNGVAPGILRSAGQNYYRADTNLDQLINLTDFSDNVAVGIIIAALSRVP